MTTNQQRAADLIEKATRGVADTRQLNFPGIAAELVEAGLIAPDLPEHTRVTRKAFPAEKRWEVVLFPGDGEPLEVVMQRGKNVHINPEEVSYQLTPAQARLIADAIYAAANAAEGKHE